MCTSRSLSFLSNRCKNHWREREIASSKGSAMGGKNELGEIQNFGEEGGYLYPPRISSRWGKLWTGLSGKIWAGLSDPPRKTAKDQNWSQWHAYSIGAGYLGRIFQIRPDYPAPLKLAETALLKRSYILNPDSVFDVLGLVEITATKIGRASCRERV